MNPIKEKSWITQAGLPAVVWQVGRSLGRYRCGYVGISSTVLQGKEYTNPLLDSIRVHGGLTFSKGPERVKLPDGTEIIYPGVEATWWFGFDCTHAWDRPIDSELDPEFPDQVIRTLEFCIEECEQLAEQLAAPKYRHFPTELVRVPGKYGEVIELITIEQLMDYLDKLEKERN